jgi:hypothetical protein
VIGGSTWGLNQLWYATPHQHGLRPPRLVAKAHGDQVESFLGIPPVADRIIDRLEADQLPSAEVVFRGAIDVGIARLPIIFVVEKCGRGRTIE